MGEYKNQVWLPEYIDFLMETKDLPKREQWEQLCAKFPELHTTYQGFSTIRCRYGIAPKGPANSSNRKPMPLYSEHEKKGYCFVKVSKTEWWSKGKFIWVATHPEEVGTLDPTDSFIFLDGNNRNFDWRNIERIHRREQCLFHQMGGVVKDNPEATRVHILQARMKLAMLDIAEKNGLVRVVEKDGRLYRVLREDSNKAINSARMFKYHNDPEWRKKYRERQKKYLATHPEQRERHKVIAKKWYEEHKNDPEFKAKRKVYNKRAREKRKHEL